MTADSLLSVRTVADYLRVNGHISRRGEATARELAGGISNVVLRVDHDGGSLVVKQSLPKLRVSVDWEFDRARILGERDCMIALAGLLGQDAVPGVLFSDEEQFVLGMTCAPDGGVVWKDALLAGIAEPVVAQRAGVLLARLQRAAAADATLSRRFDDISPLIQGRVDPYHRTAAIANPDLAPVIDAEVDRLLATHRTLVLGDFAPKNMIAYPDRVLLLDFEVAHWGDPAFDVAFLLTHLILKAYWRPGRAERYLDLARDFWRAYRSALGDEPPAEGPVVCELACLLLSRVDGKSKVEYLTDAASRRSVRALARELLADAPGSVGGILDLVRERLGPTAVRSGAGCPTFD